MGISSLLLRIKQEIGQSQKKIRQTIKQTNKQAEEEEENQ
jgi:hypothetical protein